MCLELGFKNKYNTKNTLKTTTCNVQTPLLSKEQIRTWLRNICGLLDKHAFLHISLQTAKEGVLKGTETRKLSPAGAGRLMPRTIISSISVLLSSENTLLGQKDHHQLYTNQQSVQITHTYPTPFNFNILLFLKRKIHRHCI